MPDQSPGSDNTRQRVQRHRDAMRESGLRLLQIWVPDTRREGFAENCQQQSQSLKNDPNETDTLDWIEHLSDDEGWE